ncbi:MAG: transglycosylase domain-containing protein [Oscillospiraceae bacterium]|nr:transglycosylase domain-containing protein [Oscillospiraceae bacterium]
MYKLPSKEFREEYLENAEGNAQEEKKRKKKKMTVTKGVKYVFSVIGTTFLTLMLIVVITVCVVAVALTVYITQFADSMYGLDLKDNELNFSSFIMAFCEEEEDFIEILQLSADENRIWVDLEDIPQHMINALVSTEDRRYYEHDGVDWTRTIYIGFNELLLGGMERMQGGSTITQQLVRDISQDNDFNVGRKLREIFRALSLEQSYSKHDILESYLNRVAFGPTVYGVGSAARFYFDKEAHELTIAESAILVALLPSPVGWNPYANPYESRKWQVNVIHNMFDFGYITYTERLEAQAEQVQFRRPISWRCRCPETVIDDITGQERRVPRCNGEYFGYRDERWEESLGLQVGDDSDPYFRDVDPADLVPDPFKWDEYVVTHDWYVDAALKIVTADLAELYGISNDAAGRRLRQGGYRIYLNVNLEMQKRMEEVFLNPYLIREPNRRYERGTPARDTLQGSFVLMDMEGNVLAVAGGVGEKPGNDTFNRATQARRSVGSAIKPFSVYAPAVDAGLITYSTMLLDRPGLIPDPARPGQTRRWPMNFGNNSGSGSGQRAYRAMAISHNTIAARTLDMVGVRNSYNFLQNELQIELDPTRHIDYSPLATGMLEMRLHELAGAYQIFGTGGVFYEPGFYSKVVDRNGETIMSQNKTGQQVIGADTAWVVNRMMWHVVYSDGGTGRLAATPGLEVVGKTGTANSMSDVVYGGLTPEYVGVVRIGYDDNREMKDFGRAPDWWRRPALVWKDVMDAVVPASMHERRDFNHLVAASGAQRISHCSSSGLRASAACRASGTRDGWYTMSGPLPLCTHDGNEHLLFHPKAMEDEIHYRSW